MKKTGILFLLSMFLFSSCNDYIAKKREGMRPLTHDTQESQEEEN